MSICLALLLSFNPLHRRCVSAGETGREDWYLLNQILRGGNPLWSTSKFTPSLPIWSFATHAASCANCVCACMYTSERGKPADNAVHPPPPRSLLPQSAPSLLYFFKLLLLRSDWHRQALLWAQERVWGREGKGTVLQLSILATMPEVVVARLSVLLWMRCTDAHLNSKPPVSIAVQTDLHPGLCTCYWSL